MRLSPQDFRRHDVGVQVCISSEARGCVDYWNQEKRSWALRVCNPTRDFLVAGAPKCIRPLAELLRQRLLFKRPLDTCVMPPKIPHRKPRRMAPWLGSWARTSTLANRWRNFWRDGTRTMGWFHFDLSG